MTQNLSQTKPKSLGQVWSLFETIYKGYTGDNTRQIISLSVASCIVQILSEHYKGSIIIQDDVYYVLTDNSLSPVADKPSIKLVEEMIEHRISTYYDTISGYLLIKGEVTEINLYVNKQLSKDEFHQSLSRHNSYILYLYIKSIAENSSGNTPSVNHTTYINTLSRIKEGFNNHPEFLNQFDYDECLVKFGTDYPAFVLEVKSEEDRLQQESTKLLNHQKNILALWQMFLLFLIPILLYHLFS